ncbi:MAG: TonB-dependent receptor [Mediterranea sp.]|jgi:TonB-linked SusC/RagA family outer membrane protein|nr:TonB-dependent receptor [Mediterranea sp.]
MNKFIATLCGLLLCIVTYAQEITVTGKVSSQGETMPGVSITLKGVSGQGTITTIDGNYTIKVPGKATLVFSYIGYQTKEVAVAGRRIINVEMEEESQALSEVTITVPYGTQKKSTFTGSVGVLGSKQIEQRQVSNITNALQGTVAGLQSFSTSGQPGEDANIYIRGIGSATANATPLYVVDGVPYDGALSSIATQDIATITVLKDASASTLYGSRAANGVIMITTKQGTESAPTIELSAKYGFSSRAVRDYDQVSTNDYYKLQWEGLRNKALDDGLSADEASQKASNNLVSSLGINPYGPKYPQPINTAGDLMPGATPMWDDSWEDALTQNAHYADLNARISGGTQKTKYYFSLGYLDNQGAYIESGFKRYSLRSNITTTLRNWLQVGLNVSGTHSIQHYPKQDDTTLDNVVLTARSIPSFYPVFERDPDNGAYLLDDQGNRIYDYGSYRKSSYNGYNLAQSMQHDKHNISRDAASLRGFLQITPIEGLSYKMSLSIDYNSKFIHDYTNPTYGKAPLVGSVNKSNYRTTGMTYNNVVNYRHTFHTLHKLHVMAGQEYYEYNTANFGGERTGIISDGYYEPDAASTLTDFSGNSDQYKLLSFFGSGEYSFNQRYFVSASVRADGSSRFAPKHRWGTFWSVGASWKIYQEHFLQTAAETWLSNLSLRASYGAQGNDKVGYYAYQGLYNIGSMLGENSLHMSRLATPNLSWETNLNLNIGLDFGFLDNRINGSVEFFNRASSNLLFSRDLMPSSGFQDIDANIGKVRNYGWEFTVHATPVKTRDWTWNLSVNATTYKNKIVSLPSNEIWQSSKKWVVGGSLYDFWLYEWGGVNPENGDAQWAYYDAEGTRHLTNDYSRLTSEQKVKAGSSLPKVSGGFDTDLTWKGLTLSALFSYAIGGKLYNNDYRGLMRVNGASGNTLAKEMMNRWTPDHTDTNVPRLKDKGSSDFTSSSTRWLVDRSFLRLKSVGLTYNLPKRWLQPITLKDASVFVQGENLLTFSKQQGLDPEQPLNGMVSYRYPAMKTFSFGINVKL